MRIARWFSIGRSVGIVLMLGALGLIPGFAFGALDAPILLYPTASDSPVWKGKIVFKWRTDSAFSQYHINLPNGEALEETIASLEKTTTGLQIGEYSWAARSCNSSQGADLNCGAWSAIEAFEIAPAPDEFSGGLIPCGREVDDASTPGYDESDPCGIFHIFLLLKNLLDFILWKVSLSVLLILAVITGATSYFSLGGPNALARIKTVFRSFFVGFFILMFAWMFVNIILMLFGFQFKFFGKWWEISF
jgi:hypothetical protein